MRFPSSRYIIAAMGHLTISVTSSNNTGTTRGVGRRSVGKARRSRGRRGMIGKKVANGAPKNGALMQPGMAAETTEEDLADSLLHVETGMEILRWESAVGRMSGLTRSEGVDACHLCQLSALLFRRRQTRSRRGQHVGGSLIKIRSTNNSRHRRGNSSNNHNSKRQRRINNTNNHRTNNNISNTLNTSLTNSSNKTVTNNYRSNNCNSRHLPSCLV